MGTGTLMKSMGRSLFIQQLCLRPHARYRRGLHSSSQTHVIPGFKNQSCKTTAQRGSRSHASWGTSLQPTPLYPTRDLYMFSYFHPTPLLMDAKGSWVRRLTKISFRDQDKLNWFLARPAQRWVTPQIQFLICPLYSLSSHQQRRRK